MNAQRPRIRRASPATKLLSLAVVLSELVTVSAGAGPLRERLRRRAAKRARIGATRAPLPPGVEKRQDVSYGGDRRQRMDVYFPPHPKRAPVVLMVHGGGWRYGDKANRGVAGSKVARWVPRGYVFVSVNYRMLPEADPLAQAEDVVAALTVAQGHAQEWGADPERFILMGHSAGAHLVALLSAQPARALARGAKPWLGAIVIDSAALDVEAVMNAPHLPLYDDAFGTDPAYWRSACPSHALSSAARPMLLVCSTLRKDDPCAAARNFAGRAASLGVRVEVLPQALSHGDINKDLGLPGEYTRAVERFMRGLLVMNYRLTPDMLPYGKTQTTD